MAPAAMLHQPPSGPGIDPKSVETLPVNEIKSTTVKISLLTYATGPATVETRPATVETMPVICGTELVTVAMRRAIVETMPATCGVRPVGNVITLRTSETRPLGGATGLRTNETGLLPTPGLDER